MSLTFYTTCMYYINMILRSRLVGYYADNLLKVGLISYFGILGVIPASDAVHTLENKQFPLDTTARLPLVFLSMKSFMPLGSSTSKAVATEMIT